MPNWKKVIVSGSDAALNSLLVTNGATVSSSLTVTGSLNITGSIQTPNWIDFKTGSDQPQAIGRLGWDDGNGTLNLGLKGGNVNLQLGQEMIARVYNADSVPLTDGMIVYISGSQGNRIAVKRAVATSDALSANTLGMVTEPISVGAEGFITTQGVVNGLNTSALTPGAILYLSSSAGEYTPVKPTAPIHTVIVGYVQRSHATVGSIYVKIDNGYELGELHDVVDTTTTSSYGDLLVKSGSVWTNSKQLTGSYGLTGSLTATSFVGPLQGTASWATNALTASYTPSIAGTDNYIPRFNGSSALENSVMYDDGTNIGIGTTSPSYKLDVNGTLNVAPNVYHSVGGNKIFTGNGSSFNYLYTGTTALTIINNSDTTELIRITDGGNVGIGTTNPSEKLHIRSSAPVIRLEKIGILNWYSGNVTGNNYTIYPDSSTSSSFNITSTGNVGIGTTNPGSKLDIISTTNSNALFIREDTDNSITHNFWIDSSDHGQFWMYADGQDTKVVLSTAGVSYLNGGNVGIGTTNPGAKLDVNGDTIVRGYLYFDGTSSSNIDNEGTHLTMNADDEFRINTYASGWQRRLTITDGGNVGIGTTTPTSNLQVESNNLSAPAFAVSKSFSGGGDGTAVMHAFGYDSGIANTGIQVGVKGTGGFSAADAYPLRVFNQGTIAFDVKSNNGIKFNLYGSGTFTGTATQKLAVDSSGNVIEIPIGAGPVDGSGTANYVTKWTDSDTIGNSVMYDNGTNIGIGTASPTNAKLEIVQSTTGEGLRVDGATGGFAFIVNGGSSYNTIMRLASIGGSYSASTPPSNGLIVEGNVGIGTTSPAYKLSVVGKMALNDGGNSVFIGDNAGLSDDATANLNVAIGTSALQNNVTGASNVAIGNLALNTNLGSTNTAVGANALQLNTTGVSNTAVGAASQLNSGIGTFNTSVGTNTLFLLTTGSSNAALGSSALRNIVSSSFNTAVGASALQNQVSGSGNTAIGTAALLSNVAGSANQAIGSNAGRYFGTGTSANIDPSASIFIGRNSRANASGETNQIVIGNEALGLGSDSVVLGNDNIVTTALKGNVGIGTTTPQGKLSVDGGNFRFNYGNASSAYYLYLNHNSGQDGGILWTRDNSTFDWQINNLGANGNLGFYSYGLGNYALTLQRSNGYVGIGTNSPSYTLDVNGTGRFSGVIVGTNTVNTDQTKIQIASTAASNKLGFSGGANFVTEENLYVWNFTSGASAGISFQYDGVVNATTFVGALSGNATTATNLSTNRTNWNTNGTISAVVGQLAWKNYGNNHTIFDASNSTSPGGGAISNTNPDVAWTSTYPTLMGWNGSNTYGVRVDSARTADSTSAVSGTTNYIAKFTSGTAIGNSIIYETSSNIGIGTTSPGTKLDITGGTLTGNVESSYALRIRNGSGNKPLTFGSDSSNTFIQSWGSAPLFLNYEGNNTILNGQTGNVGIGTTTPGAKLEVNGSFRATTKSFIINHPTKENKKLQYGVLEGPEHSVYVRGKLTNTNVIQLPDYWHALIHEDSITVNLTAIGKKQDLWVEEITDTHITVASETGDINCFYAVFAERKDVEKLVTEFDKE